MTEWRQHAACRGMDPELFFSDRRGHFNPKAATTCATCPVTHQCLEDALRYPEAYDLGWRAGTTAKDRRTIRRQRNRKNAAA